MAQKKLKRFNEIKSFPNVMEYLIGMEGKWNSYFKNNHPIVLELACGKGEYTVGLATLFPEKNFIGIDIKGNRIWAGAKKALDEKIENAAFLRTQIDKINDYFAEGEIDSVWITFPDPQLRISKASKRLTHPKFLRKYLYFLKPGGVIHLKTDSPQLYNFTKLVARLYGLIIHEDLDNVYEQSKIQKELKIQTHYEGLDISGSNTVFYLSFSLPKSISENDEALHAILRRNVNIEHKLVENVDYYYENGLMVLTRKYHIDRGYCCGNGCRNCPYFYENVPEPLRSTLLLKKDKKEI